VVGAVSEHTAQLGELPIFWRSAPPGDGGEDRAPVLYLHGVPTSSDDWVTLREHARPKRWWSPRRQEANAQVDGEQVDGERADQQTRPPREWTGFLERSGGLAPDLPGFGRSGKPGHFDYSIGGYARFIEQYLELVEVERVRLVLHDWGAVGLAFAQLHPERIERLVIMNAVPFLPGYEWHRMARRWRTPGIGELVMGATTRLALRRATREANATPGPLPEAWLDSVLDHFDQGTQRAILRLYRSAPSDALARAGLDLGHLQMPTLVVWGLQDPYIPARYAKEYAQILPHAELLELPDAGHWWWLDRPDAADRVLEFLAAS
jgi:pimeloyl-ACP methyl ester carboxylesterase